MKKKNNILKRMLFTLVTCLTLLNVSQSRVYAGAYADGDAEEKQTVTTENSNKEQVSADGWVKTKSGTYYYVNNKYVTGWKKIDGHSYYFNSKGIMQTNKMISKNKFVNKKGQLIPKAKIYSQGKQSLGTLKKEIKKEIRKYNGTCCVYVKNLDTNEYMVINNKKMKPASLIKLYNMGTVYNQIEKGKLKENKQIKQYLNSMITVSSNDAYNELLGKIGKGNTKKGIHTVSKFCKDNGYKNTICGGTLMPSYYSSTWERKSLTTVQDCGHILEDIYRGNLVSEKASAKMLKLLKAQQRKGKIPAGLPKGVKSANKTGETSTRQHDAAIVFSKNADYIIVVMTEGDGAGISHIQNLSRITYQYFNSK